MELYTLIGPPHLFFVFSFSYFQRWLTRGRGIIVDWDLWKIFFFFFFILQIETFGLWVYWSTIFTFPRILSFIYDYHSCGSSGFPNVRCNYWRDSYSFSEFFFFLCSDWLDGIFSHIIFHFFSVFFYTKKNKLKRKLI